METLIIYTSNIPKSQLLWLKRGKIDKKNQKELEYDDEWGKQGFWFRKESKEKRVKNTLESKPHWREAEMELEDFHFVFASLIFSGRGSLGNEEKSKKYTSLFWRHPFGQKLAHATFSAIFVPRDLKPTVR